MHALLATRAATNASRYHATHLDCCHASVPVVVILLANSILVTRAAFLKATRQCLSYTVRQHTCRLLLETVITSWLAGTVAA